MNKDQIVYNWRNELYERRTRITNELLQVCKRLRDEQQDFHREHSKETIDWLLNLSSQHHTVKVINEFVDTTLRPIRDRQIKIEILKDECNTLSKQISGLSESILTLTDLIKEMAKD